MVDRIVFLERRKMGLVTGGTPVPMATEPAGTDHLSTKESSTPCEVDSGFKTTEQALHGPTPIVG